MAQSHTEIAMKQIMADRRDREVGQEKPDTDIASNVKAFVQRRSTKPAEDSPWFGIPKNRGDELAARTGNSIRDLRTQQREKEEEEIS